jgi:hypothetical protein
MHELVPHHLWTHLYQPEADPHSPFYGQEIQGHTAVDTVYNYYIHPFWDNIGSSTLYVKLLYASYEEGFAIIELLGEWNDALHNDIMYLRRALTDELEQAGIQYFILLGAHVMDFHGSDEAYYEEWQENLEEGWIAALDFRAHVVSEMKRTRLGPYLYFGGLFNQVPWRTLSPTALFKEVEGRIHGKPLLP